MKNFNINNLTAKTRALLVILSFALIFGIVISATFAYLWSDTETITNDFYSDSNLTIDLAETTGAQYKVVPGDKLAKDPKITVNANSEPCYLFIRAVESANFPATYTVRSPWTAYPNNAGYYYLEVETSSQAQNFYILAGESGNDITGKSKANGFVTCKTALTNADLTSLNSTPATLQFKVVAIQQAYIDLADAFSVAKPQLA